MPYFGGYNWTGWVGGILFLLGGVLAGRSRRVLNSGVEATIRVPTTRAIADRDRAKEPGYWRAVIKSWIGVALVFVSPAALVLLGHIDWIFALVVAAALAFWGAYWATAYWTYITRK